MSDLHLSEESLFENFAYLTAQAVEMQPPETRAELTAAIQRGDVSVERHQDTLTISVGGIPVLEIPMAPLPPPEPEVGGYL